MVDQSANAIIAQALQDAGVPPANIEVPPDNEQGAPVEVVPNLDGTLKGQVKGEDGEPLVAPVVTPEPAEPKSGEPVVPPLTKADIVAAISEATSKIQSATDKKINAIQYQMTQTINGLNQFFQAQTDSGFANLSPEEQTSRRLERLENPPKPAIQIQPQQLIDQQGVSFYQLCVGFLDAVGIKVDDPRIDWAKEPDMTAEDGFNRFKASVRKALVADQTKVINELKDTSGKAIQQLRKKTGVDDVSTRGPGGAGLPDLSKMTPMQLLEYGFQQEELLAQEQPK